MWHASIKPFVGNLQLARELAHRALEGVGDATLGEWPEAGNAGVFHLRRRLSDMECQLAGGLVVRDIRGMPEERRRFALLFADAPHLRAVIGNG